MVVEIKARIEDVEKVEKDIKGLGGAFVSEVEAVDVYFNSKEGANLKIGIYPEGHLPESGNFLFLFEHDPISKKFRFKYVKVRDVDTLRYILDRVLGTKVIIRSKRRFYKLGDVIVLIVFIEGLGNYLCLQGENESVLRGILAKLNIGEDSLETKSFDMLVLEQMK